MKNRMLAGVLWASWLPFASAAYGAAAPGAGAIELFPDRLLVKGKGFEIRRSQVEEAAAALKASLASQGQNITESRPGEIDAKLLERLLLNQICLLKASEEDRTKAKESADKVVAETRRRAPSEESFRRQLLAAGMKPEQFEAKILEQAVVEKVLERELKSKVTVTAEQVREFYEQGIDPQARELQTTVDKLGKTSPDSVFYADGKRKLEQLKRNNLARLDRPEQVRACHLLVYTIDKVTREELPPEVRKAKRDLLEKAIARLKSGEEFSKVAREISEDPEVQQNNGEYLVARDTTMAAELKAALFALPVNQISDIITTKYGLHVAKVLEVMPAGKSPFDRVEKDLKEYLLNQEVMTRLPAFVEAAKKELNIEVLGGEEGKP